MELLAFMSVRTARLGWPWERHRDLLVADLRLEEGSGGSEQQSVNGRICLGHTTQACHLRSGQFPLDRGRLIPCTVQRECRIFRHR